MADRRGPARSRAVASPGIQRPVESIGFTYEERTVVATPGTSVASALLQAGFLACRDAADGPRGVFCGMGVCGECIVDIDGTAQLACMTKVQSGIRVTRQPSRSEVHLDARAETAPETERAMDCLVIGAGPAGLAAAAAAAAAGVQTVLVDERVSPGGQFYKQPAAGFAIDVERLDRQYRGGRALIQRAARAGVDVLSGVKVWGAAATPTGGYEVFGSDADRRWLLRPQRIVLATGAYERAVPFPGWTLPGVMSTGAAQSMLRAYQVAPGHRILVAGNGPLNVQLAAELTRAGCTVVALVELADVVSRSAVPDLVRMASASPGLAVEGARFMASLRTARVPLIARSTVIRAAGEGRVEHATVARVASNGEAEPGTERPFEVDAVCLGMGFLPSGELARLLGARHHLDRRTGGYVIKRSATGRTSLHDVWAIGDGAQVQGAKVAESVGGLAGRDVAASLGRRPAGRAGVARRAARARRRHERFQRALWRVYEGPNLFAELASPETIICRCESITLGEVATALGEVGGAGALKRLSRVGMGRCQGRLCGPIVAELVARRTGRPAGDRSGFAPQLPFRPTPVAVLASPVGASPGEPV